MILEDIISNSFLRGFLDLSFFLFFNDWCYVGRISLGKLRKINTSGEISLIKRGGGKS